MVKLLVKHFATKRSLSRYRLAKMSGVSRPLVCRYWSNNTTEIKLEAIQNIARALGIRVVDLFEETEEGV